LYRGDQLDGYVHRSDTPGDPDNGRIYSIAGGYYVHRLAL
jgi:hypothetical protein